VLATVLACVPVLFLGKSLLSPQNWGVPLFYDRCPALPGYTDCSRENVLGADVGAMQWAFFPLTVAEERSLKQFGEFPLWNRYNSGGLTLIGQGQMMLGDPLQWLIWLTGAESLAFDLKFVFLRAVFAAALGLAVFTVTRAFVPAALVAFAAPYVGYFAFRVNHPSIFTLCYSPLILLAWLKLVYGEERRRPAWLLALVLANWLVLNSGTAKEASMAMLVQNAIGAALCVVERSRFAPRWREHALFLAGSGACFLLIALPMWGSLLDGIRLGTSQYSRYPTVLQTVPGLMLGFVDNVFFNLSLGTYCPAINPLLFAGLAGGVLCALRKGDPRLRRAAIVLTAGCLAVAGLIWGAVPASWLMQVPFVRNIIHIHNTFGISLVAPACVLGGIGFAHFATESNAAQRRRTTVLVGAIFVALFALYVDLAWPPFLLDVHLYAALILACLLPVPALVFRLAQRTLAPAGMAIGVAVLALLVGRGAMYPDDMFDRFVFNPKGRVRLTVRPPLVDRFAPELAAEPARVLGYQFVLFPGYNATLGLESINGPDAIWNARYRELAESLELPFEKLEIWRMRFRDDDLATHSAALDLLGVRIVLASLLPPAGAGLQYLAEDGRVTAFSRPGAWPRAFYTDRAEVYDDVRALAARVVAGDGRPFVAVERRSLDANPVLARLVASASSASTPRVVRARDYVLTNNTTSFTIDAPAAGLIYLGETDEPGGFIATINGAPTSYVPANHAFKAVVIDRPGTYRITFRYWPAHLSAYLALAAAGLVLWLVILLVFWRRCAAMHRLHSVE